LIRSIASKNGDISASDKSKAVFLRSDFYIEEARSGYLAQDIGERGGGIMKKKTSDQEMPVGKLTRIKDLLPPPSELAQDEDNVKITISLKRSSVDFFRREAGKHHTKYQRMIRELLDWYASQYRKAG
jgi:hypothetical protein